MNLSKQLHSHGVSVLSDTDGNVRLAHAELSLIAAQRESNVFVALQKHHALPSGAPMPPRQQAGVHSPKFPQKFDRYRRLARPAGGDVADTDRSEEHTSELQSLRHLVCR